MLKELLVSVVSGIIVALILQIVSLGRRGGARAEARAQYAEVPRRSSFAGGLMRFILAVAGGMGIAFASAPFVLHSMRLHGSGGIGPIFVLTVTATLFVWLILSAMTRR